MTQTRALADALATRDLAKLQDLAFQPGGFGGDDIREEVWRGV